MVQSVNSRKGRAAKTVQSLVVRKPSVSTHKHNQLELRILDKMYENIYLQTSYIVLKEQSDRTIVTMFSEPYLSRFQNRIITDWRIIQ